LGPKAYHGIDSAVNVRLATWILYGSPPITNEVNQSANPRRLCHETKVSLVIPCYNEDEVLPLLIPRVVTAAKSWGSTYEIIVVDDGSRDRTWELISQQHHQDSCWKGVRLSRNFGHQIALWTGLQHVTGDVIAVIDADLQDPPEILAQFFRKWEEGFDVIYAVRRNRKEHMFKRMAYYLYYRVLRLLSQIKIPLDTGDFCVMDREVLQAMLASNEQVPFVRGLRAWVGFKQTALSYDRDRRAAGKVKYTFRKLVHLGVNGILSFSTRPLRLATYLGFIVSGTAFLGVVFMIIQHLFAEQFARMGMAPPAGIASVLIAILFLGGVQLLCLGILGEYVGRIYDNVKGRPLTVIRERLGVDSK
jgi:polyisoprenyl-phosphate glycosyltransferase